MVFGQVWADTHTVSVSDIFMVRKTVHLMYTDMQKIGDIPPSCLSLHSSVCACLSFCAINYFCLSLWSISILSHKKLTSDPFHCLLLFTLCINCSPFMSPLDPPLPPLINTGSWKKQKKTRLINNPPKANSPTTRWANSSYQPQIRLCLFGSLTRCIKTPLSDSTM